MPHYSTLAYRSSSFTDSSTLNVGLVGKWTLDNTPNDSTVYANHGTLVNSPSYTTGHNGGANTALALDGVDQYMSLTATNFVSERASDTAGAISLWFDTTLMDGSLDMLLDFSRGDSTVNTLRLYVDSALKMKALLYSGGVLKIDIVGNDTIDGSGWRHIVLNQTGSASTLYIDTVAQTDTDSGEWIADIAGFNSALFGARLYLGSFGTYLKGSLDDIWIWNRSLTTAEIAELYAL